MKIIDNPKKTKSWQYVTNEKELEEIKDSHPIVGKILEYRKLNSILTERTKKKPTTELVPDLFGFNEILKDDNNSTKQSHLEVSKLMLELFSLTR